MYNTYFISIVLIINTSLSATFFDTFCTFFGKTPYQTTIKAEYSLALNGTLTIANIDGNITVQSDPHLSNIIIYATKHTAIKEHLEHIDIINEEIHSNGVMLRTSYAQDNIKGSLDYTISVPCQTDISIVTHKGNISIKDVSGTITAKTEQGNIHIYQAHDTVYASIAQHGDITIIGAQKRLDLTTNRGSIHVLQSESSVAATSVQGDITITCKKLACQENITSQSSQGNITVSLPTAINAQIDAQAPHGTVTCEIPVSIASTTTTLDKSYWQKVKQELHGHFGNEPMATILLTTQKGNIFLGS